MMRSPKAAAMTAGLVVSLAAASIGQVRQAPGPETLKVTGGTIDWIEKSDVSALQEGVIEKMELEVGDEVDEDGTIGSLHTEIAELTVKKAQVASDSRAEKAKAEAQEELALAVVARDQRLIIRDRTAVSQEELQKHQAEVKVASAMVLEADDREKLAAVELELARRALKEHTISAPFAGVITERMKHPGESLRANEPVVRMCKVDRLRVVAWIPIDFAYRVAIGALVEVSPNIPNAILPIEQKKFGGKITFVDPEVEPVQNRVRIFAEVKNSPEHELRPGLKADMIVALIPGGATPASPPAVGARLVPAAR